MGVPTAPKPWSMAAARSRAEERLPCVGKSAKNATDARAVMAAGASTALPDGLESQFAALQTLKGHTAHVSCVAAFTLPDETPRALSGTLLHTLEGHTNTCLLYTSPSPQD